VPLYSYRLLRRQFRPIFRRQKLNPPKPNTGTLPTKMPTPPVLRERRDCPPGHYHIFTGCNMAGPIRWGGRTLEELKALVVPDTPSVKWQPAPHSEETLRCVFPSIEGHSVGDYCLLFGFQLAEENTLKIKAALRHRQTNTIILLTGKNQHYDGERAYPSVMTGWYVHASDMIAPSCFWNAFKAC
jgi:hypothetical protein